MGTAKPLLAGFDDPDDDEPETVGDDDSLFDPVDDEDEDDDDAPAEDVDPDDSDKPEATDELTVYASQGVVVMQPPGDPEARLVYTEGQAVVLAAMLRKIEGARLAVLLEAAAARSHLMGSRARPGRMY